MNKRKSKRVGEILQSVEILNAAAEGTCIARVEGKVIFVEKAVPGDVVDIRISSDRKDWLKGEIIQIHKGGADRVSPFCQHYSICGGCKWQQMSYPAQLKYKEQQVRDALERIGKVEVKEWLPIKGCEENIHYRNKLHFSASNKAYLEVFDKDNPEHKGIPALGYHVPQRFDKVFDVETCYLMPAKANEIRNWFRDFGIENAYTFFDLNRKQGLIRDLMLRCTSDGQWMVIAGFGKDDPENIQKIMTAMQEKFPDITSLLYVINTKLNDSMHDLPVVTFSGTPYITETLGGLKFKVQAKSFFQTNSRQAEVLYSVAKEFAGLTGQENVYDLYSGTGTIGLYVSGLCKKVAGIEFVEDAIADAYENAHLNKIDNASFFAGDMVKVLNDEFIQTHGKPDVIITDPPRAGMHPDVVKKMLEIGPDKIVYISCNPATQARDLAMMKDSYEVMKVQPVDMFPHTHHVENVVLLSRQ